MTWSNRTEIEARMVDAMIRYVKGKPDRRHCWPSVTEVAHRCGWGTVTSFDQTCRRTLGASPGVIWRECIEAGSVEPIHRRAMLTW